ncbi:MAG: uncharacterized protein ON057_000293 [Glomeribacter sp. 1016415]|uniref:Large ribosomal RNA subunit accumulation protein YceD n=1 Tax=Mycoavidus cysteinexigens TaxID=1553431 RepID=A0A2Z6ETT1_9BURK|nr:DUF177 domain-containing protein [Mycoavidus cysteinexigens]MCX8565566.1 uncharacterized protein [Glomeribacter sp. 1016415]BBE08792.1 Uncharacterized protein MCB1EB_0631 [Mycoavidus cysteinexigens]GLR01614.1 hypothetical protein GCM10007934_14260 [Mycoavidus cysteinexigens]
MSQTLSCSAVLDNPRMFDVFAFARKQQQASGEVLVQNLSRILNEVTPDKLAQHPALRWNVTGAIRQELVAGGKSVAMPYLRLTLEGALWLECQRCLEPYQEPLTIDIWYRIVQNSAQADAAPANDERADVIVGSRQFDLIDLIDEELLLSLPLVPKHSVCPFTHESIVGYGVETSN